MASGVSVKYKDSCGEMQNLRLTVVDDTNKKQGTMWIAAMQRVQYSTLNLNLNLLYVYVYLKTYIFFL